MKSELRRTHYVLLNILYKEGATIACRSLSLAEIIERYDNYKSNTIYKHLRKMEKLGLVQKGVNIEKAAGWIITDTGKKLLPEEE